MIERNFRTQNPGIKYSLPATILEQRLLFFSWLPSSFSINSFSEPKVKVIDAKYKCSEKEMCSFFTSWVVWPCKLQDMVAMTGVESFFYVPCLASEDIQKLR